MDRGHAHAVLRCYRGNGAGPEDVKSGKDLEVGLNPGAATRIRTGNGQCNGYHDGSPSSATSARLCLPMDCNRPAARRARCPLRQQRTMRAPPCADASWSISVGARRSASARGRVGASATPRRSTTMSSGTRSASAMNGVACEGSGQSAKLKPPNCRAVTVEADNAAQYAWLEIEQQMKRHMGLEASQYRYGRAQHADAGATAGHLRCIGKDRAIARRAAAISADIAGQAEYRRADQRLAQRPGMVGQGIGHGKIVGGVDDDARLLDQGGGIVAASGAPIWP